MSFINQAEISQEILSIYMELDKSKKELSVFLNSFEGDSKTATNVEKEQQAVAYWNVMISNDKTTLAKSINHMNEQIEQALQRYEKTKQFLTNQIEQCNMSHSNNLQFFNEKLTVAQENLQRKINKKKPKRQLELEQRIEDLTKKHDMKRKMLIEAQDDGRLL